jgi:hypothetical protein
MRLDRFGNCKSDNSLSLPRRLVHSLVESAVTMLKLRRERNDREQGFEAQLC